MTNVKNIGKELLGKSLDSFHRKLGLEQIEKNNEMQTKILQGIYSQVDDNYLEKTEQSNVIHLDGSGDGVVEVVSIEGNTKEVIDSPIQEGLVCWLEGVDDISNNIWKDRSGFRNDGTIIGGTDVTNGFRCVQFNGKSTCVLIPNPTLNLQRYTVELTLKDYKSGYWCGLFGNTSGEGGGNSIYKSSDRNIGGYPKSFGMGINFTDIQTLTFTIDCVAKTITIYVDGVYTGTNTLAVLDISLAEKMVIGARKDNGASPNGFSDSRKMDIYSLKIYNRCLSNTEIELNYQINSVSLLSSFEEKKATVNGEDKYEIEILNKNRTITNEDYINHIKSLGISSIKCEKHLGKMRFTSMGAFYENNFNTIERKTLKLKPNTDYTLKMIIDVDTPSNYIIAGSTNKIKIDNKHYQFRTDSTGMVAIYPYSTGTSFTNELFDILIEPTNSFPNNLNYQENKLKLLVNEPLRGLPDSVKDKLCIINNKLMIERNCGEFILNGGENFIIETTSQLINNYHRFRVDNVKSKRLYPLVDNMIGIVNDMELKGARFYVRMFETGAWIYSSDANETVSSLKTWISDNNTKIIYALAEPYYEEVTNEYGEPILLEGYENGTLYIDSIIVPTTSVRYTQKFESRDTLKTLNKNNNLLSGDINDNIVPYMMDIDFMITEKEMALMSQLNTNNIMIMEVLDMTSMQKRTQEMLERLFKTKTLTKDECLTRVTTYLSAKKITDGQAEELILLIEEIYA